MRENLHKACLEYFKELENDPAIDHCKITPIGVVFDGVIQLDKLIDYLIENTPELDEF